MRKQELLQLLIDLDFDPRIIKSMTTKELLELLKSDNSWCKTLKKDK